MRGPSCSTRTRNRRTSAPTCSSRISIQTERRGHYTNFQGVVSAFEPCFPKKASVADAETLFAALASDGVSA